jgi:uncharacterized protein (TIGR02117 family)
MSRLQDLSGLIKSLLRTATGLLIGFTMLLVLYLVFAFIFTFLPSNMFSKQPDQGITVYLKSNGVHTDIIVPTETKLYNWSEHILPEDFGLVSGEDTWTAFGWGDKGFYLNTPEWSDLKFSTAMDAIVPVVGESAMHVTLYDQQPKEAKHIRKIILTEEQYLLLNDYIFKSFTKSTEENFILLPGHHYNGVNDNFYEAEGDYNLFQTCNNWTNSALKAAGVKTAFWAPFDKCVLYHF